MKPSRFLELATPEKTGTFPVKELHPPEFWLEAGRPQLGQYTILNDGHYATLLQGKPSLLTFSLIVDRQKESIDDVYATVDGVKRRPRKMISDVTRDSADCKAPCAIDIILPPVNKDSALIELFVTSAGKTTKLSSGQVTFDKPYARQLTIAIQPIQIMTPFYSHAVPDTIAAQEYLSSALPSMLPIRQDELFIYSMPVQRSYSGSFNLISTTDAAARGIWNTIGFFSTGPAADHPLDLMINVVACGNVGQEGGSSYRLRRATIFVEDCKMNAVLHEIGHSFGLNTMQEQYDQYPPDGRPVEGATLFLGSQEVWLNGFNADGVVHLPGPNSSWGSSSSGWMDIMSAAPDSIWPRQETLNSIYAGLRGRLGTQTSSSAAAASISGSSQAPAAPPAPGFRRLFLYGETNQYRDLFCMDPAYNDSNPLIRYRFQTGTVWAMDLTPLAVSSTPPAAIIRPDPFYYCYANYQEPMFVYFFDAGGSLLSQYNDEFAVEPTFRDVSLDQDYWFATLDVPEAAHRMRLESPYGSNFLDLTVEAFTTQLAWPAPGATLTSTLTVQWNVSGSGSQPLRHLLFYRTNNSQPWAPLSQILTGNSFTFSTDILPASNTLSLLLLSSNGLRSQTSQVDGLIVGNHAPRVTIFSPRNGDVAQPGTPWGLRAFALDTEDGPITSGSWTSSLDGALSVGSLPTVTLLSPGTHRLTFSASDLQGLAASSSVTITVSTTPTVDLGWLPGDLKIVREGMDPIGSLIRLTPEITHTAYLGLQNTGVPVTVTVSLYLQDPLGVEILLLQEQIALEAFAAWSRSVKFIPELTGSYSFRAKLENMTPVDANPANNQRIWSYSSTSGSSTGYGVFLPLVRR